MAEKEMKGTLVNINDIPDVEVTKGVSFDPDVRYEFEVTQVNARKLDVKDADGHSRDVTVIEAHCTCLDPANPAVLRISFFTGRAIVNEEDKQKESPIIKFARGVGYPVALGKKIKFGEIVRQGIKFSAMTRLQKDKTGKETPYSEIILETMSAKKGSVRHQSSIGGSVSDADTEELVSLAKGFANKETLIGHLATAGKTSRIDAVLKLDSAGKLTYKA